MALQLELNNESALCHSRASDNPPLFKRREHRLGEHFRAFYAGGKNEFGMFRRLVSAADSSEVRELARARELVQALGIARFADLERGIDINLDELLRPKQCARHAAFAAKRRNEADDHD